MVYSKNRQRLRHLRQQGAPLPGGSETNDDHCFIYGALIITGYAWILHVRFAMLLKDGSKLTPTGPPLPLRSTLVPKLVNTMGSVGTRMAIASPRGVAARVR